MNIYIDKDYIKQNLMTADGSKLSSPRLRKLKITETAEQLYNIFHELSGPKRCTNCGKPTQFLNFVTGYHEYCSAKCSANSAKTQKKRCTTNLTKYGETHPMKNEDVQTRMRQKSMETHGVTHPAKLESTTQKRKDTCLHKYGVDSVNKIVEVRQKQKETMKLNYGVEYPYQCKEINDRVKKTLRDQWLPKKLQWLRGENVLPLFNTSDYSGIDTEYNWQCITCGTQFMSRLSDGKIPRCPQCKPYGYNSSKMEHDLQELITSLGFSVITNSRSIIHPFELDLFVPAINLAIEVNGDYWHSELRGKNKKYHLHKLNMCDEKGIRLVQIQATEWKNNSELVKSRIMSLLQKNTKLFGRKCKVRQVSAAIANSFLDFNHIQGHCQSKIQYGLYYEDNLVAVMTFGRSRFNKKVEWELLRYCSKKGVNITGGAGKLFSQFKKQFTPDTVISYCDKRWNSGKLYAAIGFTFSHNSPPNYKYTSDYITFQSRIKFQKHKLAKVLPKYDQNLTEWVNMKNNGYDRIWDCGNSVWTFKDQ